MLTEAAYGALADRAATPLARDTDGAATPVQRRSFWADPQVLVSFRGAERPLGASGALLCEREARAQHPGEPECGVACGRNRGHVDEAVNQLRRAI